MHDIDTVLREKLGSMDSVVPGDSAQMLRRVSAVRRRRAVVRAAACCVALLVVGTVGAVGAVAVCSDGDGMPPVGSASRDLSDRPMLLVEAMTFGDANHGYVLTKVLDEGQVQFGGLRLAVTEDGGATWQPRPLPDDPATFDGLATPGSAGADGSAAKPVDPWVDGDGRTFKLPALAAVGPKTVVLFSSLQRRQWTSKDGGRTWSGGQKLPNGKVDAIPEGGLVFPWDSTLSTARPTEPAQLRVIGPDGTSGTLGEAAVDQGQAISFSSGTEVAFEATAATNGTFWLACNHVDGAQRMHGCVASSRDRGRTWQTVFPIPLGHANGDALARPSDLSTVDGRVIYFLNRGGDGRQVPSLLRSSDAGQTWSTLPLPPFEPAGAKGQVVAGITGMRVLPNGDLVVVADGLVYRMPAGRGQYQLVTGAPKDVDHLVWSGSKLIVSRFGLRRPVAQQDLVYTSVNGIDWTVARLP